MEVNIGVRVNTRSIKDLTSRRVIELSTGLSRKLATNSNVIQGRRVTLGATFDLDHDTDLAFVIEQHQVWPERPFRVPIQVALSRSTAEVFQERTRLTGQHRNQCSDDGIGCVPVSGVVSRS
ncbi:hypothetical protein [Cryobacterium sp. PAMC25264]|uniref:hypothetical protein n=1 Tax=Cryobacterium sp. PAMC25264 TaxID=2861288 RepID=UPI001C63AF67|nr:hypothetical protein [Cryobacterium sp. PAMC25264]QYF74400.1 hypothetical protein KY500_04110 [Cryobacterium sp. PAMC25264]